MAGKVIPLRHMARPVRAGRARVLQACRESGLTQAELGASIGTTDRGVRRLLRRDRQRPDRMDLFCAAEAAAAARKKAA